jgi:H+/Cl- antiporter ClcA
MMRGFFVNIKNSMLWLVKWLILSLLIGWSIGLVMSGFGYVVEKATQFRLEHWPIILGLPFAGLIIVFCYRKLDLEKSSTSTVIEAVRKEQHKITFKLAPLILISTILTHLFGGSSGREGAALQFGGSVGSFVSRKLKMNDGSGRIFLLAAMSASFAALFGTPLAAAIFPMEFVSVGVLYYAALVPCVLSAFVAHSVTIFFGTHEIAIPYEISNVPGLYSIAFLKGILLGILCALVGIIFCESLHYGGGLAKKWFKNPYLRVVVGGCLVILLTFIVGNQDYNGLSSGLITESFNGTAPAFAFLIKILFTVLTLCMGFKGGEIVPSFVIGATFGCLMGGILGLPINLAVACGMCGVFCAVTNSPITSLLIAFELFGFDGMGFFAIVVAISYMLSGYYSVFGSQKIMYSKFDTVFINKKAGEFYADVKKKAIEEKKEEQS